MYFASYLLHPLGLCVGTPSQVEACKGYNFWSGIGSDFSEITLLAMFGTLVITAVHLYVNSRCHVGGRGLKGCRKHGSYPFNHYKLCRNHHPQVPKKLTSLHIVKAHLDSLKQKADTKDTKVK